MASLITAFAGLTSLSALAQTASGKAFVPPFDARYASSSSYFGESIFITNITSNPINVALDIYNQTGVLITTNVAVVTGNGTGVSGFALNSGGSTAVFTLAANSTTELAYTNTTLDTGYASIAWTQSNSKELYGLLADVKEVYLGSGSTVNYVGRTLAVNNNLPF